MSSEYESMMRWAQGLPVSQQVGMQGGLRSWEMNQPGLVSGAGGLPGGMDYAPLPGSVGGGGDSWYNSGPMKGFLNGSKTDPLTGAVTQQQGWGMPALGAASGLFNAWMGMKQYGLAKDQLAEGKQQFALNYDAQRTTTNSQLEDRQRARVASNPGAYQSVGAYMDANSVKPRGG